MATFASSTSGGVTRRTLVAGSAALAAAGAAASLASATETRAEEAAAPGEQTGRQRPEAGSRQHPTPMHTGYVGPDAAPIAPLAAPQSWDEEYDVVVVGSGWGGLSASVIGAQAGLSVTLVEKTDMVGGASRHAAENMVVTGGSKGQEEFGYHWPGDAYDPKAGAAKYQDYCDWTVDDKLLLATIEGGKDWADWMSGLPGVDWVCIGSTYEDRLVAEKTYNTVLGNTRIADALEQNAKDNGVAIKLMTQCTGLVQDGGRVVGIQVEDENGDTKHLKANKAVLLTAGGFGVNLDLLEQYAPTAYMYATQGGPMFSHTGECFRMGLGLGADVSGYNSFSMWEGGLDEYWGNGDGSFFHYFWNGAKQVAQNPWLTIDKAGNRMEFFSLGMPGEDIPQMENWTAEVNEIGDLTNACRWSSAVGHRAYSFMDADFEASMEAFQPTFSAFDPHRGPIDASKTVENTFVSTDWKSEFQDAVDRGAISKADTLEELAEMLGLNPDKVVAAVEHWNEICEAGEDTELPVPYLKEWLIPLKTPPYYGFAKGGQISKTMTGLRVNEKMQVLNVEGETIPGLYAGWYTAGGIGGENNYGGQFGNPTLHGGVAISGVGGYMAMHAILDQE